MEDRVDQIVADRGEAAVDVDALAAAVAMRSDQRCATIAAALARMPTRRFAMARFERGARQPRGHRRPDAFDIPAHAACLKRGGRRRNGPFVRAAKRDRAKIMSTETLIEPPLQDRSEEPTSELQSLMRNSYAVFCLKKKKT